MIKKNGGIFGRNPTYNDVVVEGVLTLKEAQVFDNDITINGDLTVNGTTTTINTVELNVDDKNITMGAVVAKVGLMATSDITAGQFTVQLADTAGLIPGMTVTKTSGTGAFGTSPKIASVDSHYQITLDVAHATSGTIIFDTGGATDDTADGGGITLKGTTDKFIKWVKASVAWVFSDPIKAPDVTVDNLTASKPVFTDANKKLTSTGTLAINQGGTGQITQQAAMNALAGAQTSAQFLRGDGTDVKMSAIQASDVPTLNQNTTGNASTATTASNLKSNATTGLLQVAGPGAGSTRVMTTPDSNFTAARTDAGQTFTGAQNFGNAVFINGTVLGLSSVLEGYSTAYGNIAAFRTVPGDGINPYLLINTSTNGITLKSDGSSYRALVLNTAATDRLTVAAGGDVTVNTGNLVIGTSGKGIDFSATANSGGTTNSELLSDYEEGDWTPVVTSGTGAISAYNATGTYTKVGRLVTVFYNIQITSNGTGASYIKIAGLPYTIAANRSYGIGYETDVVGFLNSSQGIVGTDYANLDKVSGGYPGGTSYRLQGNFSYIA